MGAGPSPIASSSAAQRFFESRPPGRVTLISALVLNAYGLLLMLPVLLSFLVVASLPLSWFTYLLPLVAMALGLLILPFGFGNPYVGRLVADLKPADAPAATWLVQLTTSPRARSGTRALLEDADDFGWLMLRDGRCEYRGDAIRLSFPLSHIAQVRLRTGGVRGLFIPSTRIQVTLAAGPHSAPEGAAPGPLPFEIAERGSLLLPHFHRASKALFAALKKA